MKIDEHSGTGVMRMSFCDVMDGDHLNMAAVRIRALPAIQRVRVEASTRQLEILYRSSTERLVQQIHAVLQSVTREDIPLHV